MKKLSMIGILVGAAVLCAAPISLHQSQDKGVSFSVDKAQARIGRPLTPGSIAGVNRRHNRRRDIITTAAITIIATTAAITVTATTATITIIAATLITVIAIGSRFTTADLHLFRLNRPINEGRPSLTKLFDARL